MINLLAMIERVFIQMYVPERGEMMVPPPEGYRAYIRTKGAGRWIYCKNCHRNVMPVVLTEIPPGGSVYEMVLCSQCGYGLTPSIPAAGLGNSTTNIWRNKRLSEVFPQAVIPTTSLFLIEELVGDKLDGYIYELKATSATESIKPKEEMPYKWALAKIYQTPFLFINYSFKKYPEEPFSLPMAVELARKYDIGECWIKKLTLHVKDKDMGNNLLVFRNRPVTRGSDAEKFVFNFYKKRKMTGWIKNIPRRHLPLTSASVFPRKNAHLDWRIIHNSEFISWLNRVTYGLVLKKEVKRTVGDKFIDLTITQVV